MFKLRPAWSWQFAPDRIELLSAIEPLDSITPDWAWGGSTGKGVKVAVIDSGVGDHPKVGRVDGHVWVREEESQIVFDLAPHDDATGHGTACAGIIRSIAPDCEIHSVRVLGKTLGGRAAVFMAGLRWALENGMHVCNLSLGTAKRDYFGDLHELADLAYFQGVPLVVSANNMPLPMSPAITASVISVASHGIPDPYTFYYNPRPPAEFGAWGLDVPVAWQGGTSIAMTGNSFAAPHISGIVTLILSKRPDLNVFQLKAILRALSANVVRDASAPVGERRSRSKARRLTFHAMPALDERTKADEQSVGSKPE